MSFCYAENVGGACSCDLCKAEAQVDAMGEIAEADAAYLQAGATTPDEVRATRFADSADEDPDSTYDVAPEARKKAFAYLATLALYALRGKVRAGMPVPIRLAQGGSHVANLMPLTDNEHKVLVSTRLNIDPDTCDPQQLAEALLVELVGVAKGEP